MNKHIFPGVVAALAGFCLIGQAAAQSPAPVAPPAAAPPPASAPAAPAPQPGAPLSMADLQTMVADLGYTTTPAAFTTGETSFSIQVSSTKYTSTVTFLISPDNSTIYMNSSLANLTPAQLAKLPWTQMLISNQTNANYYGMNQYSNPTSYTPYLDYNFRNSAVTPQMLRQCLTNFVNQIQNQDTLWNPSLWQTSTTPAAN